MKILIAILSLALSACAAGDRFYAPGQVKRADGSTAAIPVLVASLNRDAAGDVAYEGYGHKYTITMPDAWAGVTTTKKTFDKKGVLIGEEVSPVIAGASTSSVIRATGDATAKVIDASGNTIGKGAAGAALGAAIGPAIGIAK